MTNALIVTLYGQTRQALTLELRQSNNGEATRQAEASCLIRSLHSSRMSTLGRTKSSQARASLLQTDTGVDKFYTSAEAVIRSRSTRRQSKAMERALHRQAPQRRQEQSRRRTQDRGQSHTPQVAEAGRCLASPAQRA
jgi:hypothetical protein